MNSINNKKSKTHLFKHVQSIIQTIEHTCLSKHMCSNMFENMGKILKKTIKSKASFRALEALELLELEVLRLEVSGGAGAISGGFLSFEPQECQVSKSTAKV